MVDGKDDKDKLQEEQKSESEVTQDTGKTAEKSSETKPLDKTEKDSSEPTDTETSKKDLSGQQAESESSGASDKEVSKDEASSDTKADGATAPKAEPGLYHGLRFR